MDATRPYRTHLIVLSAVVVAALAVAAVMIIAVFGVRQERSGFSVVQGVVGGRDRGGLTLLTFTDEGRPVTVRLPDVSSRKSTGDRIDLYYPPGQPTLARVAPDPTTYFFLAAGALLIPPLLYEHHRRTRLRLAVAEVPVNVQMVDVEVRHERAGRSRVPWALIRFGGTSRAVPPDLKVRLGLLGSGAYPGRFHGAIAGDLRQGGVAVLWINGRPVRVAGTLTKP